MIRNKNLKQEYPKGDNLDYLLELFADFKDHIQLEKFHEVKFKSGSYENESSCRGFIKAISEFFFQEEI